MRGVVHVTLAAQLPFVEVAGRVTVAGHDARQGRGFGVEPVRDSASGVGGAFVEIRGDPPTMRILTRDQSASRRRSDRRVDVVLRETQTFGREPVDVWPPASRLPKQEKSPQHMSSMKTIKTFGRGASPAYSTSETSMMTAIVAKVAVRMCQPA